MGRLEIVATVWLEYISAPGATIEPPVIGPYPRPTLTLVLGAARLATPSTPPRVRVHRHALGLDYISAPGDTIEPPVMGPPNGRPSDSSGVITEGGLVS